jgi:CSLREA domain-containing protein
MSTARFARALLTAACLLLALPAFASASQTVDTVEDEPDAVAGGECKTASDKCSLRAAIEVTNLAGAADTVNFDATVFQGQQEDTIVPATPLPAITSPLKIISAKTCVTEAGANGPCAGVEGPSGNTVLTIEADGSSVSGLAITGGAIGIGVFGASTGFTATSNWIGLQLNGANGGATNAGIFLDPGSDKATIGGSEAAARNVISFNIVGLDIEGASEAVVRGNWFGMEADGTNLGPAVTNIEITNLKPLVGEEFKAEDNEIGTAVSLGAEQTAACDGGCNVISSAIGKGIDLVGNPVQGETPATGPTTIRGNYVGLNPAGTAAVDNIFYKGNAQYGIFTGAADKVAVGGPEAGATNFIAGGAYGVYGENGDDLFVFGNVIGLAPTGASVAPPTEVGIFAFALTLEHPEAGPVVVFNSVLMGEDGVGIEHRFSGAQIVSNFVEGGANGILTEGEAEGSLIAGNLVQGSGESGIVLRNPDNEVLGNEVVGADGMGIEVDPGTEVDVSGNVIGGDSPADENVIFGSGGYAILIRGIEASRNEVRRNHGSGNEGEAGFIVLRPYDPNGGDPNGVKRPTITTAAKTEVSGKAQPGALVRVFRKASTEEGELAGFVGEAVADGSGQWKATFAPLPEKTIVVASQTLAGGSSELSETATTPPDPPAPPSGGGGGGGGGTPPGDTTRPNATITKAPKAKSTSTTAQFKFKSNEAGSAFKCKLDKTAFAKCRSPKTYKKLKPGKHVFKVNATDAAGNVSAVVKRKFTVLE